MILEPALTVKVAQILPVKHRGTGSPKCGFNSPSDVLRPLGVDVLVFQLGACPACELLQVSCVVSLLSHLES